MRLRNIKGKVMTKSSSWMFKTPEFTTWNGNDPHNILWINGSPGKGKTMLIMGIIDMLSRQSKSGPAYFFCQRTDWRLKSATSVLRGLLYRIVMEKPAVFNRIQSKYDIAGRGLFEDVNSFYAMSEILHEVIQDLSLPGVVLVIDALDECEEGLPQLLDLIGQTAALPRVKWLVSSRCRPDISDQLKQTKGLLNLDLEIYSQHVSNAVDYYIEEKVSQIMRTKNYDDNLRLTILKFLKSRAGGSFLWPSHICKALTYAPRRKAISILESFPSGLQSTYQQMWTEMQRANDPHDMNVCMRILGSMISVRQPMRLFDAAASARLPGDVAKDTESVKELVQLCGSFLTVRGDFVTFVHHSARKYLEGFADFQNHGKQGNETGFF